MLLHYAAQVLIMDCWFTVLTVPHTVGRQNRLPASLELGDICEGELINMTQAWDKEKF